MPPDNLPGALNPMPHGGNPQLIVLDAQHEFLSRHNAERLAHRGRNHDSAIFINFGMNFIHVMIMAYDTSLVNDIHKKADSFGQGAVSRSGTARMAAPENRESGGCGHPSA